MLAKIILIPILLVVFFAFSFLCYKKAPPTMAIIVTGFGLSKPKGRNRPRRIRDSDHPARGPAEHAAVKGRC